MEPLTLALLGAGLGVAKSELFDRPREARQRKAAAATAQWSPWTGMRPGAVQEADPFNAALQGALAGAVFGQAGLAGKAALDANADQQAEQASRPFFMQPKPETQMSYESPYALMQRKLELP